MRVDFDVVSMHGWYLHRKSPYAVRACRCIFVLRTVAEKPNCFPFKCVIVQLQVVHILSVFVLYSGVCV